MLLNSLNLVTNLEFVRYDETAEVFLTQTIISRNADLLFLLGYLLKSVFKVSSPLVSLCLTL